MGKLAYIFSGQGAQYIGMGKELFENVPSSRRIFEKANSALGFDIAKLCFEGPNEELNKTENTQPAILTMSIAALEAIKVNGIIPDVTAGLSLGEYSALVCSGVIDFITAVKLVKKRGKFMQEAVPEGKGSMAAVLGLDADNVRKACEESKILGIAEISNFNCPGQIVIAGEVEAIKLACEKAKEKGAKRTVILPVSAPFHTSMLKPAGDKLELELLNIKLNSIHIPIITNVTADYVDSAYKIKDLLKRQVMSSVLWEDTINKMIQDGVDTFVEFGPGKVLGGFIKKIDRNLTILNVEDLKSLNNTIEVLRENRSLADL